MSIHSLTLRGSQIEPYIDQLGHLRITVFADWPYLYHGDLSYERKYLQTYIKSKNSFAYLLFENESLIGATTAILLSDETADVQKPFIEQTMNTSQIVYFGESLLLPKFRGQGIGKTFMKERLEFAKNIVGVSQVVFCSVQRNPADLRRPSGYIPLDDFWKKEGFLPMPNFVAEMSWKDIGDPIESKKKLQFWSKLIGEA